LTALFYSACGDNSVLKKKNDQNTTLFEYQWHLENTGQKSGSLCAGTAGEDINVVKVWQKYQGLRVKVAVVDTGIELDHYDLHDNIDTTISHRYSDGKSDPSPDDDQLKGDQFDAAHGTACAGIIAGVGDNNLGIKGVAPKATLVGLNAFSTGYADDFADALYNENRDIDISSNSWNDDPGILYDESPELIAIEEGVLNGRIGKGVVYVFAAGNEREDGYNSNWNRELNNPYVITAASLNAHGKYSSYSNPGANILISAYGGEYGVYEPAIVTTDLMGSHGADSPKPDSRSQTHFDVAGNENGDFTNAMNGTSAAAPMIAGVCALILEANPNLTYRDVKYILATTARKNDPREPDWIQNGAGLWVNHNYGFGAVDAHAAVLKAEDFAGLKDIRIIEKNSTPHREISDNKPFEASINIDEDIKIEYAELTLELIHGNPRDLEIVLQSPDETNSTLSSKSSAINQNKYIFDGFTFGSVRYLDESSKGTWKIFITDRYNFHTTGTLYGYRLKIYGREP